MSTLSPTHPRLSLVSQQMFLPWSHGGCPETDFQSRYLIPQNLHPVGDGPSRTSSLPDRPALWRSVAISMKPLLGCPNVSRSSVPALWATQGYQSSGTAMGTSVQTAGSQCVDQSQSPSVVSPWSHIFNISRGR